MIGFSIVCFVIAAVCGFAGYKVEHDVEYRVKTFFESGEIADGESLYIVAAFFAIVGLIFLIVGLSRNNSSENEHPQMVVPPVVVPQVVIPENRCSNCNSPISTSSKFCGVCGTKQNEENVKTCPHCGLALEPDSIFCTGCGKDATIEPFVICLKCATKNQHKSKYCKKCGEELQQLTRE